MTTEPARAVSGGLGCLALAVLAGCNTNLPDANTKVGVKAVSAGAFHTCALMNDLTVRCWGLNQSGALGNGTHAVRVSPGPVIGLGGGVARISAGYFDTCAQLGDGTISFWGDDTSAATLLCWGDDLAYIFGAGGSPNENRLTPTPIQF